MGCSWGAPGVGRVGALRQAHSPRLWNCEMKCVPSRHGRWAGSRAGTALRAAAQIYELSLDPAFGSSQGDI